MLSMAMAQRLAQLGEEIERVENQLRERRRLLFAFWRYLPKDQKKNKGSRAPAPNAAS